MSSPKSNSNRSKSLRSSFNIFYFATGDAQKDSGLEIEFMLVTRASCSIVTYRTFWEISQFHHPIVVHQSNNLTKTYSGQKVPMIGYATIEFSYDPNGEYSFALTVWITEKRTQNLLGMEFCQNQASGIHFDLPGIELRQPSNTFCYGSLHQKKHILIFLEFLRSDYLTLCTSTLKAPDVGSIHLETQFLSSLLDKLFNPTGKLWPQVLFL